MPFDIEFLVQGLVTIVALLVSYESFRITTYGVQLNSLSHSVRRSEKQVEHSTQGWSLDFDTSGIVLGIQHNRCYCKTGKTQESKQSWANSFLPRFYQER